MALTKERLIAQGSDLDHSDKIASLLLDVNGNGITSTDNSGKQSLDVNVTSAIDVNLSHVDDSIKIGDGTTLVGVTSANELQVSDANALAELESIDTATTTLASTVDSGRVKVKAELEANSEIKITDGTDVLAINSDGSINVVASELDVRNLNYTQDSVSIAPQSAIKSTSITASSTAFAIPTTALANRQNIYIQNLSSKDLYIGDMNVTINNGLRVAKGATIDFPFGAGITLYGICETGVSGSIRVLEIA